MAPRPAELSVIVDARDSLGVLRLAFEEAPFAVVVASAEGTILLANPHAEAIFAYSAGELIGQPISRLLHDPLSKLTADLESSWTQGQYRDHMVTGVRKDGVQVPLEIAMNALAEHDSRYFVASIADITDRVNLEARLSKTTPEHMDLQRVVVDLTRRLGDATPDDADAIITEGLRLLCEALTLDQAMLWRRCPGDPVAAPTHSWTIPSQSAPEPILIESIPFVISKLEADEAYWFNNVAELPDPIDRETFGRLGARSGAVVPLPSSGTAETCLHALALTSTTEQDEWAPPVIERLRLVAAVVSQTLARVRTSAALQQALNEVHQLRHQFDTEPAQFRREVKVLRTSGAIVSESRAIMRALAQVEQVAPTPATVLLLGETGSGKEVLAQAIHDLSPRHQRQMVRVSCAAIPAALIESELFGRERGAYTGALSRQIGRFEAANRSTLFLDEIGELPADVQVKLLRVLQDRTIERLGSTQPIKVDVRIIAATNRNLEEAVKNKLFREDFYYRLNVFPIEVPPLRDRLEDIPGLVWSFIDEFSRLFGKTIDSISKESLRELQGYSWPGNVRELRNVIERAVILATGRQLVVSPPRPSVTRMPQAAMTLSDVEVEHIRSVLESSNWRIRGRGGAAERLGLKPTTLESRMARLGITRKNVSS